MRRRLLLLIVLLVALAIPAVAVAFTTGDHVTIHTDGQVLGRLADGRNVVQTEGGVLLLPDSALSAVATPTPTPTPEPTAAPTPSPTAAPTPTVAPTPTATPAGSCTVTVSSASAVRSAVGSNSGGTVCYSGTLSSLDLSQLQPSAMTRVVGNAGATVSGAVSFNGSRNLSWGGRARSVSIVDSSSITVDGATLGGTAASRALVTTVQIQGTASNITVEDSDIGWTEDDNNNAGYGIRILATSAESNITIQRNRLHHIAADGIQVGGAPRNLTIDRNEIAYVACHSGSGEHSDWMQFINWGAGLRVTNNYLHHLGYRDENHHPADSYPSGGWYFHGGNPGGLVENNLALDGRNMPTVTGLGTGGTSMSNLTWRRNTMLRLGTSVGGVALRWMVTSGSGNLVERNVIQVLDATSNSSTTFRSNLTGTQPLDTDGNCTSAACNPAGQEPIGYRKPTGVTW